LQHLIIGGADGEPKLAQYSGQGPLAAWVRVVVCRMALRAVRAARKEELRQEAHHDERALTSTDVELKLIRSRYRAPFKAAFQRALAELAPAERNVLRLHFVEGLSHREIARLLGVHQTTITRQLARAQQALSARLRQRLKDELNVNPRELASLVRALRSGFEMSLR
jgi:RNA polymerase sigma-70 factor (ECF subfamily)